MTKVTIHDIENKVELFVDNQQLFTAYDITKSLRHDGLITLHNDVKEYIRNTFSNSLGLALYKKNWNPLVKAFVYHPVTVDVSDYKLDAIPEFLVNNSQSNISDFRSRGRFTVKREYIDNAEFEAGDLVYVEIHYNIIKISDDKQLLSKLSTSYFDIQELFIDKYGNLTLSKGILERAFGSDYQQIHLIVNNHSAFGSNYIQLST